MKGQIQEVVVCTNLILFGTLKSGCDLGWSVLWIAEVILCQQLKVHIREYKLLPKTFKKESGAHWFLFVQTQQQVSALKMDPA